MEKTIDIFQFTHFRKYLDEYQAARVQTDPEFTRAGVCALLGLPKTRSYYNDIVKGKKLTARMIPKFVEVLGLNKKEAKYFETMVNFDQAKTTTERNAFFDELINDLFKRESLLCYGNAQNPLTITDFFTRERKIAIQ